MKRLLFATKEIIRLYQQYHQIWNVAKEYEEITQTRRKGVYFDEGVAAALTSCFNPREGSSHLYNAAHADTKSSLASTDKK